MDEDLPTRPDPQRAAMARSFVEWSALNDVARAIAAASESTVDVYVERLDSRYRWSLAVRGGPYPLLRVTARFLRMSHYHVMVDCETLEDGWAVSNRHSAPRHACSVFAPDKGMNVLAARAKIVQLVG